MEAVWKEVQPLERVLRACWFMDSDGFMVTRGWAASEWFPQCAIQTPSDCMTSGGRCMPTVLSRQLLNGLGAKIQYRKLQVSVILACMKFLEWTIHGSLTQHQNSTFPTTLISEHNVYQSSYHCGFFNNCNNATSEPNSCNNSWGMSLDTLAMSWARWWLGCYAPLKVVVWMSHDVTYANP